MKETSVPSSRSIVWRCGISVALLLISVFCSAGEGFLAMSVFFIFGIVGIVEASITLADALILLANKEQS